MSRSHLAWFGDLAKKRAHRAAVDSLRDAAERLYDESQRLVPLETGGLRETGRVDVDESRLKAAVSYDTPPGKDPPLAIIEHEDTYVHHDAGRQRKYLAQPWKAGGNATARIFRDEFRRTLGSE